MKKSSCCHYVIYDSLSKTEGDKESQKKPSWKDKERNATAEGGKVTAEIGGGITSFKQRTGKKL